ncbi:GAP family protein [Pseudonocardia nematodicida]|uniref:GAP family protein n=1 Tax=Pseudonocardia nematodicida TaxID=1206997 RepID=A0ABV1K6W3_9PSEU
MSTDVLVLGLASVVRPTAVAAVYAFLSARSPAPLLVAYLAAGLALSLTVGVGAVTVFHVTAPPPTATSGGRAVLDVVLGVVALGAALYYLCRPVPDPGRARPERPPSAVRRRLTEPTVSSAAVAGVVTHLPGFFYLAALAAIVASGPDLVGGLLQVGLYNLLWYSVPLAALASWTWRPEATRGAAAWITGWVRERRTVLVVVVLAVVGLYLGTVGTYQLLTG